MEDIGLLIKSINDKLRQSANDTFAAYGLTVAQANYLRYIRMHDGVVYQKQLETNFDVSHPTVVGIVKRLGEKGFLQIETDPDDHRNRIIRETPKAAELDAYLQANLKKIEGGMLKGISEEEISTCIGFLKQINGNLDEMKKGVKDEKGKENQ